MDIGPHTKVIEILTRYPDLSGFFSDMGICGCGFPWESDYLWTLEKVAKEKKVNLERLIEDIKGRIRNQS